MSEVARPVPILDRWEGPKGQNSELVLEWKSICRATDQCNALAVEIRMIGLDLGRKVDGAHSFKSITPYTRNLPLLPHPCLSGP
jgi:hypothetical protein